MTSRNLVASLNQLEILMRLAHVLELIPVATSRAKEVAAEVVDGWLNLGKFQINGASFASLHGAPPCKKGIVA